VITLLHYDRFAEAHPLHALALLEILAEQARSGLLIRHLMIVIVQTDDPEFRMTVVEHADPHWTHAEWGHRSREALDEPLTNLHAVP
jgi:hypothetical protein